jgi:addiction module HigA family antidote
MQKLELSTTIESINMSKLKNIHPGEILLEEFLIPLEITAYRLSKDIGIPQTRVSEIIKGRRRITADTALRLSIYFGNSARFWLGLQDDFDIEVAGVKFVVDAMSAQYLQGANIDYVEDIQGASFTIKNPNAQTTCGCGSSFSV